MAKRVGASNSKSDYARGRAPHARRRVAHACVLLLAVLGGLSCGPAASPPIAKPPSNVVFVLLDTLRADRVGAHEGDTSLTPRIDAFAEGSVVFEHAYSHAPWTLPSVASIFTSQTPGQHGAGGHLGAFTVLQNQAVTLAEILQSAGYVTAAISNVLFLGERFGTMQGFDFVDHLVPKKNRLTRIAEVTTSTALDWLDRHPEKPFFLFVHYFDAHITYDPPQPYRSRHAEPGDETGSEHIFGTVKEMVGFRRGEIELTPETISRLEKLYDGEVAYMDEHVGRLLAGLEERGLWTDTIVVLTSDHGEEFSDHAGFEHGHTLYDELLHVPLVIRLPNEPGSAGPGSTEDAVAQGAAPTTKRVESVVRLIDLAPTLVELAGIDSVESFTGASLLPHLEGQAVADRPVLSAGNMWGPSGRAWREGGFKLIENGDGESGQLFEVRTDPKETTDLGQERSALFEQMKRTAAIVEDQNAGRPTDRTPADLTDEERAVLRALGYGD